MNTSLFLMGYKGLYVLEYLSKNHAESIEFVVTARDVNVQNDYYKDIMSLCNNHKLKVYDRKEKYELKAKYIIAISWRWLIHTNSSKLIVLHDSLLPKYRGFNPLVSALINGDKHIGVTALFAVKDYDTGDIISQSKSIVNYPITIKEAIEEITKHYIILIKDLILKIETDAEINGQTQIENQATYSLWRDELDYQIDWFQDSEKIERFVNAVGYPYRGAYTVIDNKLIRVLEAKAIRDVRVEDRLRHVGKVIFKYDNSPVIVCSRGLLQIDKAEGENGKTYSFSKFRIRLK